MTGALSAVLGVGALLEVVVCRGGAGVLGTPPSVVLALPSLYPAFDTSIFGVSW